MAINASVTLRNGQAGLLESTAGTAPLLRLRTGAKPADAAAARSGTILVSIAFASDWANAPSAGAITLIGTPSAAAIATGTIGHWELMDSAGTTCHLQGTINTEGVTVDTTAVSAVGQNVTVTSFTYTMGNS